MTARCRSYLVPVREPGKGGVTGRGQANRPGQHHHGLFAGDIFIWPSGDLTGTYRDTVLVRGAVSIKDAVFESDLILANGLLLMICAISARVIWPLGFSRPSR